MPADPDLIIVGAGISGLASALALTQAGLKVVILEARDRIGGRIFTQWDEALQAPVELGAEFIHGRPPEIWDLIAKLQLTPEEMSGDNWCFTDGRLKPCDFFAKVDDLLGKLDEKAPDESFQRFLDRCCSGPGGDLTREWATGYVTGFHAADPAKISVHSLAKAARADEKIEGERAFRLPAGYQSLVQHFTDALRVCDVPILLGTVVEEIRWRRGQVQITAHSANRRLDYQSSRALITVPISVLQAEPPRAGALRFYPTLPEFKQQALKQLAMGKVIRVVLRFRTRFWNDLRPPDSSTSLSSLRFLFSREKWFPTWWTTLPEKLPLLVAWAPFGDAERLSGQTEAFVTDKALQTLARLLGTDSQALQNLLEKTYWHDWEQDPFSRGAYSYVKAGGDNAQHDLGLPLENTLFFAGEATDLNGHNGTVHGALASATRVVEEIRSSRV
jgi:monoamine oxidase